MNRQHVPTAAFVAHMNLDLSHHRAFLQMALEQLREAAPGALDRGGALYDIWQAAAPDLPGAEAPQDDGPLGELLALIRQHEGTWSAVNRGWAGDTPEGWPGLTSATLDEIMIAQEAGRVHAVGAYQFTPATLAEVTDRLGSDPLALFSPTLQNQLASELILGGWKRPDLASYLQDTDPDRLSATIDEALDDLAYEWASIPNRYGRGWYDGDAAGNQSRADRDRVRAVLAATRERLSGSPPVAERLSPPRYFSQADNGRESSRSCFSSACAMLAERVLPGSIGPGDNDDLRYLERVNRYGDTTQASAQIAALRDLGIVARLVTNGDQALIDEQITRWGGIALGYLHRGPLRSLDPDSSGHWAFCWQASGALLTLHDPMGEVDPVRGGFRSSEGRSVKVERADFARRWEVEGPPFRYAPGHGWAIVIDSVRGR